MKTQGGLLKCNCIFINLNAIYLRNHAKRPLSLDYQQLEEEVRTDLQKLEGLMVRETEDVLYGTTDASPN